VRADFRAFSSYGPPNPPRKIRWGNRAGRAQRPVRASRRARVEHDPRHASLGRQPEACSGPASRAAAALITLTIEAAGRACLEKLKTPRRSHHDRECVLPVRRQRSAGRVRNLGPQGRNKPALGNAQGMPAWEGDSIPRADPPPQLRCGPGPVGAPTRTVSDPVMMLKSRNEATLMAPIDVRYYRPPIFHKWFQNHLLAQKHGAKKS